MLVVEVLLNHTKAILGSMNNIIEQIISSDKKFKSIINAIPDALIITDQNGDIVFVNGVFEKLFGYNYSEIIGKQLETLMPDRFRPSHIEQRNEKGPEYTRPMGKKSDIYALKKNGEEFAADISISPLDMDGTKLVFSAVRDITDYKKTKNKIEELEARDKTLKSLKELVGLSEKLLKKGI